MLTHRCGALHPRPCAQHREETLAFPWGKLTSRSQEQTCRSGSGYTLLCLGLHTSLLYSKIRQRKQQCIKSVLHRNSRAVISNPLETAFILFSDKVFLCNRGCPETCYVGHAGVKLRELPASVSRMLGFKICVTMLSFGNSIL